MSAIDDLKYILMTGGATDEPEAEEAIQAALKEHAAALSDQAQERARAMTQSLLAALFPGNTGFNFSNEIADRITASIFQEAR